jgi:hypothetical protein
MEDHSSSNEANASDDTLDDPADVSLRVMRNSKDDER